MKRYGPGEVEATLSIIDVAKQMEPAIIQGSAGRCPQLFGDKYKPLQFVHFSDIHGDLDGWDRIMTMINYYQDYISCSLHTGDYVSGTIDGWVDMYEWGVPCEHPIYNCIGNHDRAGSKSKQRVRDSIFNHTENWEATFMDVEASMTYYKDFPDANVRLIVVDNYYDVEAQIAWLRELLARSLAEGVHVITAAHQPTAPIVDAPNTAFHTALNWDEVAPSYRADSPIYPTLFDGPIGDFIDAGGHFIAHLCGHHHRDYFGYTARGVLNIAVGEGNSWGNWQDCLRDYDTLAYDTFNVMSVDTNTGLLRLVRIGNDADYYLRKKRTLSFDYVNKKMIYTG